MQPTLYPLGKHITGKSLLKQEAPLEPLKQHLVCYKQVVPPELFTTLMFDYDFDV